MSSGVADLLKACRQGWQRLTPEEALEAQRAGALLIDTRTEAQRAVQGELGGSIVIDRTVLEWRLDPRCGAGIPEATDEHVAIVVICRQGYSSSIAVASLRSLGLGNVSDVIGGVEAWIERGLPTEQGPADIRT